MCAECDFILFDEPTRGIDIGARAEIYSIMNGFVKGRRAILMVSSDLPELLGMCDRIYVMKDGKFTAEFSRAEATQEKILAVSV
jgi:ABC-type sugar transport system ATPase subunit